MGQRTLSKTALPKEARLSGLSIEVNRIKNLLLNPALGSTERDSLQTKLESLLQEKRDVEQE